jgi:hypothetical protein
LKFRGSINYTLDTVKGEFDNEEKSGESKHFSISIEFKGILSGPSFTTFLK